MKRIRQQAGNALTTLLLFLGATVLILLMTFIVIPAAMNAQLQIDLTNALTVLARNGYVAYANPAGDFTVIGDLFTKNVYPQANNTYTIGTTANKYKAMVGTTGNFTNINSSTIVTSNVTGSNWNGYPVVRTSIVLAAANSSAEDRAQADATISGANQAAQIDAFIANNTHITFKAGNYTLATPTTGDTMFDIRNHTNLWITTEAGAVLDDTYNPNVGGPPPAGVWTDHYLWDAFNVAGATANELHDRFDGEGLWRWVGGGHGIIFDQNDYVVIDGVRMDGQGLNLGTHGSEAISGSGSQHIWVNNVKVSNATAAAIDILGSKNGDGSAMDRYPDDWHVTNCYFYNNGVVEQSFIDINNYTNHPSAYYPRGIVIAFNTFENPTNASHVGITAPEGAGLIIDGNIFKHIAIGIREGNSLNKTRVSENNVFANNMAWDIGSRFIAAYVDGWDNRDNWMYDSTAATMHYIASNGVTIDHDVAVDHNGYISDDTGHKYLTLNNPVSIRSQGSAITLNNDGGIVWSHVTITNPTLLDSSYANPAESTGSQTASITIGGAGEYITVIGGKIGNTEQSITSTVAANATLGQKDVQVADVTKFRIGQKIKMTEGATLEYNTIADLDKDGLNLGTANLLRMASNLSNNFTVAGSVSGLRTTYEAVLEGTGPGNVIKGVTLQGFYGKPMRQSQLKLATVRDNIGFTSPYDLPLGSVRIDVPLSEQTGTSIGDKSINSLTMTASSNISTWATLPSRSNDGFVYTLDGAANYLHRASDALLSPGQTTQDTPFTILMPLEMTAPHKAASTNELVTKYNGLTNNKEYRLTVDGTSDILSLNLYDQSAAATISRQTSAGITIGSWGILAVTYNGRGGQYAGDGIHLYWKPAGGSFGELPSTVTNNASYVAMEPLGSEFMIGAYTSGAALGGFAKASIGEVIFTNYEMSFSDLWQSVMELAGEYGI